jgi:hypothetical protein
MNLRKSVQRRMEKITLPCITVNKLVNYFAKLANSVSAVRTGDAKLAMVYIQS